MNTKNFRIGDRVKVVCNEFPEMKKQTYTVVGFGKSTIDIEDINGKQYSMLPKEIDLLNPEWREEDHKGRIDIKEAKEAMYYHTNRAGDLCYWIAAAIIALYIFKGTSAVAAVVAFIALVLAVGQNLWQGITIERFVRRLDKQERHDFDTYPDHISNGGWVFYILKISATLAAAIILLVS